MSCCLQVAISTEVAGNGIGSSGSSSISRAAPTAAPRHEAAPEAASPSWHSLSSSPAASESPWASSPYDSPVRREAGGSFAAVGRMLSFSFRERLGFGSSSGSSADIQQSSNSSSAMHYTPRTPPAAAAAALRDSAQSSGSLGLAALVLPSDDDESSLESPLVVHSARVRRRSPAASTLVIPSRPDFSRGDSEGLSAAVLRQDGWEGDNDEADALVLMPPLSSPAQRVRQSGTARAPHLTAAVSKVRLSESSAPVPVSPVIAALVRAALEGRQGRQAQLFQPGSKPGQGFAVASSPMLRALQLSGIPAVEEAPSAGDVSAGGWREGAQRGQRSPLTPLSQRAGWRARASSRKAGSALCFDENNNPEGEVSQAVASNLQQKLQEAAGEGIVCRLPRTQCWAERTNSGRTVLRTLRSPSKSARCKPEVTAAEAASEGEGKAKCWHGSAWTHAVRALRWRSQASCSDRSWTHICIVWPLYIAPWPRRP